MLDPLSWFLFCRKVGSLSEQLLIQRSDPGQMGGWVMVGPGESDRPLGMAKALEEAG